MKQLYEYSVFKLPLKIEKISMIPMDDPHILLMEANKPNA